MNSDNIISALQDHRSVRQFSDKKIEEDVLNEIIECGIRGSNTGNMQLYSVIVTEQEPLRSELIKLHFGQCSTAPTWLTICTDVNRYHHYCRVNGCEEAYGNLLWFESALVDATIFAQNIMVAAESKGIGGCYLGTVMYNTKQIAELLECPKGVVPVITIAMGYPTLERPNKSERLGLDAIVHREKYHNATDEEIVQMHKVRDEFPFNKEMVKMNGTRNYCEIFTTKRYPKEQNEDISRRMLEFLHNSGMMNQ